MKNIISILSFISFSILVIYSFSFKNKDISPIELVRNQYHQDLEKTLTSFKNLERKSAELSSNAKSLEELQAALISARLSFKEIETLAEKLDHSYVKNYLNGAPLPSLEPKVPVPTRLDPVGLQVLDELIFSEDPFSEKAQIVNLSSSLVKDFDRFKKGQINILFYDRQVFEACREELIRIFTLGLTGFDTPGSGNAISEAKSAIASINRIISPYRDFFNSVQSGAGDEVLVTLSKADKYLEKNSDFETFDRLEFYMNFIKPIDEAIRNIHLESGVEIFSEVSRHVPSVNYTAGDFFSTDYLNPYYYTRLTEADDSQKLQDLGKILFYDPILSANNERSCASCHNPQKAFTDGERKSIAKDFNGAVDRNAPTLINSVYATRYFHDMRALNFESLLEHVVTNRKEFSLGLIELENKIKKSAEYRQLFDEALAGSHLKGINSQSITAALSSYLKSLNTFNSEFDRYARGETASIDKSVRNGFNLFMGKAACGTCHFAPVFNGTVPPHYQDSESEILGVPQENNPEDFKLDPDVGRYAGIEKEKIDFYKFSFKTPTVRNIDLTAPYMHNGVYETLEEVMDFYNKGGGEGLGYEVPNQTLPFDNLDLSMEEQNNIIAFMRALTDTSGLTTIPKKLPVFENNPEWNSRKIGGLY